MEFEGFEVDSNDFYFAYDLDMESKTCTRLYHFHDGIMERFLHGEWVMHVSSGVYLSGKTYSMMKSLKMLP